MSDPKIKIGFIGLSATSSWGVNAHLPYLQRPDSAYRIVALLNSSASSAEAAAKAHNLGPNVRAYGSPEEFAADDDIDMVVCSVRVDKHYPILMPIIQKTKAKAMHCEWPLGKNLAEAEELAALAREKGIRTVIGLQGRATATCHTIRNLLDEGRIGKPLSVTVTASGYNFGAADLESLAYLSDISTGGNLVTIHFSHMLDTINQAVGQLKSSNIILETMRPKTLLRNKPHTYKPTKPDDEPVKIVGEVTRTSHDQIVLQGILKNGAVFSYHLRGGMPFPGTPGIQWRVYGETGEIRMTAPSASISFGGPDHKIEVHDHASDSVEEVVIPKDKFDEEELSLAARAPARVYEAFAESLKKDDAGPSNLFGTWDDAVERHRLIDRWYEKAKEAKL
jgi:predicted dehydrogenase